ncbi:MAG: PilZ domain-containing protein [Amphritea sp.]
MKDKRKSPRIKTKFRVVISHPALGQIVGHILDMSESGVYLDVSQSMLFKCGQVVGARIVGDSNVDMDPLLSMEVVRVELSGIALKFVEVSNEVAEPFLVDQNIENARTAS